MEIENILKIIDAVSKSEVMNLEIEDKDFKLFVDKNLDSRMNTEVNIKNSNGMSLSQIPGLSQASQPVMPQMSVIPQMVDSTSQQQLPSQPIASEPQLAVAQAGSTENDKKAGNIVKSPIVGTFYAAPGPEAADYVKVGDKVKKGQILCIIEAMKLMNEIESEYDGEIAEILAKNEQMVEFGQPLFRIV